MDNGVMASKRKDEKFGLSLTEAMLKQVRVTAAKYERKYADQIRLWIKEGLERENGVAQQADRSARKMEETLEQLTEAMKKNTEAKEKNTSASKMQSAQNTVTPKAKTT